jgi:hypothetical protein
MTIIQILIALFAIYAIIRVIFSAKNKSMNIMLTMLWILLWLAVITAALYPSYISELSKIAGIGRGVDFATYISIILLFYMVFNIYALLDKHDQRITELIREITLVRTQHTKSKKRR